RKPAFPDEQLRGRDVDRPRALERADGVDPACGEMAEGERQRSHHAQAARNADDIGDLGCDRPRGRAFEGENLDRLLRSDGAETRTKLSAVCSSRATTAASAAPSIAVVSSPPWPSRSTGSRSALVGSCSVSTRSMSAAQARQVSSQWLTVRGGGREARKAAWE